MPAKHKKKHHLFLWSAIVTVCIIAIGLLIVPMMINMNSMRDRLETAITSQTGISAKINGDINFGILGRTTIIAHNIIIPNGTVNSVSFNIPFWDLFNLQSAKLMGGIEISGAKIKVSDLKSPNIKHNVSVKNSVISFLGKDYYIIGGTFQDGTFNGQIRTDQHKYDIGFHDSEFTIKNKNVNLEIHGELYATGGAAGVLSMETDDINSWFEFDTPKIRDAVNLNLNFWWDGKYGFKFNDIMANNVRGDIELSPNGQRIINLYSPKITFDFSFLAHPTKLLRNTKINLEFYGDLTFESKKFGYVKIDAIGTEQNLQINNVIADNLSFTGGTIDGNGAHDVLVTYKGRDKNFTCMFSGTPDDWKCSKFTYGDLHGQISAINGKVIASISADANATPDDLYEYLAKFNTNDANIKFKFANMGGRYIVTKDGTSVRYDYVYGKNLRWLNPHIHILPEFMMQENGNLVWTNDNTMTFIPDSETWSLTLHDNFFYITGNSYKSWLPKLDLRAVKDYGYILSGYYNDRGDISDLTIKMAGHVFSGTADKNGITLHTDILLLDEFLNSDFFNNYQEMEFLANEPILIPFEFSKNIYLTADTLVHNNNAYKNFIYALKSGTQTFSITDSARGNILATIIKEHATYDIFIQLNKFKINGPLLRREYPLNVNDTIITADISLKTSGHIAHDIWYNMRGKLDLTMDGGYLTGLGLDSIYANAENISRINAEDMFISALSDGTTRIKTLRIIGNYDHGNFATTEPIELSARHTDISGNLKITDNRMTTKMDIIMRGISPTQVPMTLTIAPDGRRSYSLSDMLRYFEPVYMRSFIRSHNKF